MLSVSIHFHPRIGTVPWVTRCFLENVRRKQFHFTANASTAFRILFGVSLGLTVALAQTGKIDEARTQAKEVLRINKDATAAENSYVAAIGDPAERQAIIDLLRKAGLK